MPRPKVLSALMLVLFLVSCAAEEKIAPPPKPTGVNAFVYGTLGTPPAYSEFFATQRATYPEILSKYKLASKQVTGLGGLADENGLTGEIVIPVGDVPYKIDTVGNILPLDEEDKIIYLEIADYQGDKSIPGEIEQIVNFIPEESWKKTIERAIPDPTRPYFIMLEGKNVVFAEFQHPGPRSNAAQTMPQYAATAIAHPYRDLGSAKLVGFYGVDGFGFPGMHLHGIGAFGPVKVGGHLNRLQGNGFILKLIPAANGDLKPVHIEAPSTEHPFWNLF